MCRKCKHPEGSTAHLWYWQKQWFKRFVLTWYHILNRRAYWEWKMRFMFIDMPDEGIRMELDEFLKVKS